MACIHATPRSFERPTLPCPVRPWPGRGGKPPPQRAGLTKSLAHTGFVRKKSPNKRPGDALPALRPPRRSADRGDQPSFCCAGRDGDEHRLAIADDAHRHGVVGPGDGLAHVARRLSGVLHRMAGHGDNHVTLLQASLVGRRALPNVGHQHALRTLRQVELVACIRRDRAERQPELRRMGGRGAGLRGFVTRQLADLHADRLALAVAHKVELRLVTRLDRGNLHREIARVVDLRAIDAADHVARLHARHAGRGCRPARRPPGRPTDPPGPSPWPWSR